MQLDRMVEWRILFGERRMREERKKDERERVKKVDSGLKNE